MNRFDSYWKIYYKLTFRCALKDGQLGVKLEHHTEEDRRRIRLIVGGEKPETFHSSIIVFLVGSFEVLN